MASSILLRYEQGSTRLDRHDLLMLFGTYLHSDQVEDMHCKPKVEANLDDQGRQQDLQVFRVPI